MAGRIEDYALISDRYAAGLVCRDGGIDWLCLPRFDSDAVFATLLGGQDNGHWTVGPATGGRCTRRRYLGASLVLESEWDTDGGTLRVTDFMPERNEAPDVVRIVECVSGHVAVRSELRLRFGYGRTVPWVRRLDDRLVAVAGPDSVWLKGDVPHHGREFASCAEFDLGEGEKARFVLTWNPSYEPRPSDVDADEALRDTLSYWERWSEQCTYDGVYADAVLRSLVTLQGLSYAPTGGIVAAATTSLPETLGGERNWDYRFCWLRDATFTLQALLRTGFRDEACAWREWLLRAVAGSPEQLQILYGLAGERRTPEVELDWLGGYEGSRPVRVGNGATEQRQHDVFGEVMDTLYLARDHGIDPDENAWRIQQRLMEHLAERWKEPDEGIWEVRGPRRHFTHSKVLAWVAADRAVRSVEEHGLSGPVERYRALRDEIHADVLAHGYSESRGAFTQYYGSDELDASLLLIPNLGFLPAEDERVRGTLRAVQEELTTDGLVRRYQTTDSEDMDGLKGEEGAFLACSFWLADALVLDGQVDEGRRLFERLLGLRNDVGLLAEEYDPRYGRQVGNFPQAYSHVAVVNTALNLAAARRDRDESPAEERADGGRG
jgi:GH15 family glucan-1,4-alpha-glucosidase